jgi:hypothetical protein
MQEPDEIIITPKEEGNPAMVNEKSLGILTDFNYSGADNTLAYARKATYKRSEDEKKKESETDGCDKTEVGTQSRCHVESERAPMIDMKDIPGADASVGGGDDFTTDDAMALVEESFKSTRCKDLFTIPNMTPTDLLKSQNVQIKFEDLSEVENTFGEKNSLWGFSRGGSGSVVVEQPNGRQVATDFLGHEKHGKLIRRTQDAWGRISIHTGISKLYKMAKVIIHELGHVADKMYGENASKIIDDSSEIKKEYNRLHDINDATTKDCLEDLKKLSKNRNKNR